MDWSHGLKFQAMGGFEAVCTATGDFCPVTTDGVIYFMQMRKHKNDLISAAAIDIDTSPLSMKISFFLKTAGNRISLFPSHPPMAGSKPVNSG
jgi:hypothetical protein